MLLEAFKVLTWSVTNQLTFAECCFLHLEHSYLILYLRAALQYVANAAVENGEMIVASHLQLICTVS